MERGVKSDNPFDGISQRIALYQIAFTLGRRLAQEPSDVGTSGGIHPGSQAFQFRRIIALDILSGCIGRNGRRGHIEVGNHQPMFSVAPIHDSIGPSDNLDELAATSTRGISQFTGTLSLTGVGCPIGTYAGVGDVALVEVSHEIAIGNLIVIHRTAEEQVVPVEHLGQVLRTESLVIPALRRDMDEVVHSQFVAFRVDIFPIIEDGQVTGLSLHGGTRADFYDIRQQFFVVTVKVRIPVWRLLQDVKALRIAGGGVQQDGSILRKIIALRTYFEHDPVVSRRKFYDIIRLLVRRYQIIPVIDVFSGSFIQIPSIHQVICCISCLDRRFDDILQVDTDV